MDLVLVHGSTQAPGGWDRLVGQLAARGHRAVAVDLPTDAPELSSADYAAIAADQAAGLSAPVAVAHSLGGLLLPGIGRAVGARHLLWLATLVPDFVDGRSARAQIQDNGRAMFTDEWHTWDEDVVTAPAVSSYFLFHDCDLATLRWALPHLRLFQPRAVLDESPGPDRPEVPSTFVVPADDRTVRADWMRSAARERLGAEIVDVPGGHCPHVSRPALIADLIDTLG